MYIDYILAYSLRIQRAKCLKPELDVGYKRSIEDCVKTCTGISSLIAYGTKDFGSNGCNADGSCQCRCQWAATYSGKCSFAGSKLFRLFQIPMKGRKYFFVL